MVQIKIKDKIFTLQKDLIAYALLKINLKEAKFDNESKIWNIPPYKSNFEILKEKINEKEEFNEYYNGLLKKVSTNKPQPPQTNKIAQIKEDAKAIKEKYPRLYKFQIRDILKTKYSKSNGFLIGNSMGTGKTVTSLISAYEKSENIFIIAPAPLLTQWQSEIKEWLNKDCVIFSGSKQKREHLYKENEESIKIISYDTFKNDKDKLDLKKQLTGNILICDEATKLKNKKSQRYKAVKKFIKFFKYKLFLSGTPVTKGLHDINTIIDLIDNNIISNVNDYIIWEEKKVGWPPRIINEIVGYKNLDEYVKNIKPVYTRKTLEEVKKDMPDKNIIRVNVNSHPFCHSMFETVDEIIGSFSGFSLLQLLDCGYPVFNKSESESKEKCEILYDKLPKEITNQINKKSSPEKIVQLVELIENINEPVLIFSRYLKSVKLIEYWLNKNFKDKFISTVTAGTKNKDQIKKDFNEGKIDIVIATDTWSEGVSLPDINYLINYDISPSVDKYLQKIDRIYRINSTKPKFIYNLVGDVIETHIMNILEEKMQLIEQITEGKAGQIDETDIKKEVIKKLGGNLK